jgi:DIS3-like exonuclease 2
MRATGEHTAAVPIPAPPQLPAPGAVTEDAAEKEMRRRRRVPRRTKQAAAQQEEPAAAAGPRSCRSMPPMHVSAPLDAEAVVEEEAAGTSRSCPLLPTPSPVEALPVAGMGRGAAGRRFFQSHWPEQAVEEAIKVSR